MFSSWISHTNSNLDFATNGNEWLVEDLKEYNDTAGISSLVVTEYDGGNYTCIANNRNGNAEQTVTVFGK